MDNLYRLEEARNIIKISDSTIRRYMKSGLLKYQKFGREYRITETALMEFVSARNEQKTKSEEGAENNE